MSDLRWCLGVARWCRLPRTPSRRNSENMAPRRSYWSGTPLVLDRGHTNFRELRRGEVRRIPLLGTWVHKPSSDMHRGVLRWHHGTGSHPDVLGREIEDP